MKRAFDSGAVVLPELAHAIGHVIEIGVVDQPIGQVLHPARVPRFRLPAEIENNLQQFLLFRVPIQGLPDLGRKHLKALDAIVDPLLVSDLTTLAWAPHGHDEAVDAIRRLIQAVLIDSAQQLHVQHPVQRQPARRTAEDRSWSAPS